MVKNVAREETTVEIRPFRYPAITSISKFSRRVLDHDSGKWFHIRYLRYSCHIRTNFVNTFQFSYTGAIPIQFKAFEIASVGTPVVGRFGSDQRLYVGTQVGQLARITMNDDFTAATNVFSKEM